MVYYAYDRLSNNVLAHHGIKGQKWGVRRFQNLDGTLTAEGKARYSEQIKAEAAKDAQRWNDAKVAYGEGAGTRRKLISKEIAEKKKNKEYEKAFEKAQKNVDMGRSLKKAESLHRNSGLFVRGRYLTERGENVATSLAKGVGSGLLTGVGTWMTISGLMSTDVGRQFIQNGDAASKMALAISGTVAAASIAKGARDAISVGYYEKNRKF